MKVGFDALEGRVEPRLSMFARFLGVQRGFLMAAAAVVVGREKSARDGVFPSFELLEQQGFRGGVPAHLQVRPRSGELALCPWPPRTHG